MEFDAMCPARGPCTGAAEYVRGLPASRLPWTLDAGWGSISRDGRLLARVRGLVLAPHQQVPDSLRGTNPFPWFRAVVSCLSVRLDGTTDHVNVRTGDFAASASGDADIDARMHLPRSCTAPIVLIIGPTGAGMRWLAAT